MHVVAGTPERVIVALAGGPEGEALLRRGARIAARSVGAELLAVHVSAPDGPRFADPRALADQRALVVALGGTFHQVVADDVPRALVDFARGAEATRLLIGGSRRGRLRSALAGPGIGSAIVRASGDIDVQVVVPADARTGLRLPRLRRGALSARRRILGFVVALLLGPLLSWLLSGFRSEESITVDVLSFQLLVVVVALIGGIWPALFAAILSGLTLDFLFVAPTFAITIADPRHAVALVLYVVIAILVSAIVDLAARRMRRAERSAAESELLATVAGSVLRGEDAVPALVTRTREAFGLEAVRVTGADGAVLAADGTWSAPGPITAVPVGAADAGDARASLELRGARPDAPTRRLLEVIAAQLAAALEHAELQAGAAEAEALAAADAVRSALLSAASHDLRRPLAAAVAAIGGLRAAGANLSARDRADLLATAQESLGALSRLVTDLLDVSRVQAGVLAVSLTEVDAAEIVGAALDELSLGPEDVRLALDPDLPALRADAVLLQRIVVNVLANAHRYAPVGMPVVVTTGVAGPTAEIRIADSGPGVPPERQDEMFLPFQRLGDTDNDAGLGLGLALSRGFAEGMGGRLRVEDTPGGGLTMVVALPVAGRDDAGPHPSPDPSWVAADPTTGRMDA